VRIAQDGISLLRPGPIDPPAILAAAGAGEIAAPKGVHAPGQLASHYAPSKPLRLDARAAEPDEWFIGFGAMRADDSLSESGDLEEAAARLFAALHRAEAEPEPRIAVAPVPEEGLGRAINDRLRRAAAPKGD
jgi:L-threonylcarbamoyladenylate synthase